MISQIDTIFFDVGATLRYVVEDEPFAKEAERQLIKLVQSTEEHDVFRNGIVDAVPSTRLSCGDHCAQFRETDTFMARP